ncbi:MAG: hypothetical protein SNJ53_03310 [Thermodesulfovibrionales bacterium]
MVKQTINNLKKQVFYDILNCHGRVFIVVRYSEDVVIGKRGFSKEEKDNGLTLVFNTKMNFDWSGDVLTTRLVFGTKVENCLIPSDSIVTIFSPELNVYFQATGTYEDTEPAQRPKTTTNDTQKGNVIKVDFSKKGRV